MIWHNVTNGYPETECKCELLVKHVNGDLSVFFGDYDALLGLFFVPGIKEDMEHLFEAVHYWRAL